MKRTILLSVLSVFFYMSCFAHDLWIIVDNYYPAIGEKVTVKVMFAHNFPDYDILLKRDELKDFFYITPDGQKKEITKTWEEKKDGRQGYLAAKIPIEQEGTYIICCSRIVKGKDICVPSEKYAKAIVIAGKGNKTISKSLNNRIEIIPLTNPSEIKVGDTLPFKILYEGKPLSTYIYGTYAGYCSLDNPFYAFTGSNENGIAYLKISHSYLWLITVSFQIDITATLTFEIKE